MRAWCPASSRTESVPQTALVPSTPPPQQGLEEQPLALPIPTMETSETGLGDVQQARARVVELEEAGLDLGIEIQQPEECGDGSAGDAATAGKIALRIGLAGVQQLPEVEGLLDRVGELLYLERP